MENGVVNLENQLASRGIEMHFACLERAGAFVDRLTSPARVHVMGKKGGFSPRAVAALALEIASVRPAIIHTHNLGPLIYAALATAGGRLRPILHGEHSQLTAEEHSPRRLRQRQRLYRCCRAIHAVSTGIEREIRELGFPAENLRVIPNGVDISKYSPCDPSGRAAARNALGLPLDALVVGIVGRFGPFKGHRLLIDSFEQLAAPSLNVRLLIAGSGGDEAGVRQRARESFLADRIHFTGFLQNPSIAYHAMDLLAAPSTNEGLSNVVMEAMASGLPVLANLVCGHEFMIDSGRNGFIADLRTSGSLAAKLKEMLFDEQLRLTFGLRARETAAARFSLSAMARAYEALYRECAGGRAVRTPQPGDPVLRTGAL